MRIDIYGNSRRTLFSWLSVGALVVLCAALAVLQYRWVGEVSRAERDRLRGNLHSSLFRLSHDFNAELTTAMAALLPPPFGSDEAEGTEADYAARYAQWRESGRHGRLFQRIAVAFAQPDGVVLRGLDLESGVFQTIDWPEGWEHIRERLAFRGLPEPGRPPAGMRPPFGSEQGLVFEVPRFRRPPIEGGPGGRGREAEWLVVELNVQYLTSELLPEVIQRHLGSSGLSDYEIQVMARSGAQTVLFDTEAGRKSSIAGSADASVALVDLDYERLMRRGGGGRPGFRPPARDRDGPGRGRGAGGDSGRWTMLVRHRAGSLEAVVEYARWRNLTVVAGILGLILASVLMLMRYTRRAQALAEQQMQFVASVSHELRTPLTVIRTAAYNLRGKLSANPSQVERYGALIEQESERLGDLVEQVLQFSSAQAGRAIRSREPLPPGPVIAESVEASRSVLSEHGATLEVRIDPDLPAIVADPVSLKHAVQNLVSNAAKYGSEGNHWVGVFASTHRDGGKEYLEIRVEDRGPGIPPDEQRRIFDPFVRGKRAVQDQIHGTGLGLSLVKSIVEGHEGTVTLESEPMKRTAFIIRIPAAPGERVDEFAHSAH